MTPLPRVTRRAAGVLAAVTWLVSSACVAVFVLGVVIAVEDQSDHQDSWDGFGTGIAVAVAVFFVPLLIACGVLLAAVAKGLRHEDAAQLHTAGRTTMVACGAMALVGLLLQRQVGSIAVPLFWIPALLLVVPSSVLASRTRPD